MTGYAALFVAAFGAATILPFYSEFAVAGALAGGLEPAWILFWATLGNTLGAVVNWLLGRYLAHFQDRRWFPFRGAPLERAQRWFQRVGVWTLLMAWAPVGGDALTFIAGLMRVHFGLFLVLVAIGKGARYAVVLWLLARAGVGG